MSDEGRSPAGGCLICGSSSIRTLGQVDRRELVNGYASPSLNVKAQRFFPPDVHHIELLQCESCDLRWFSPGPIGDGPFYEELQQHDWYYQSDKPEYAFAASKIAPGARVIEIGCGAGEFAKYLPDGCSYRGLEFNQEAIRKARERGLDVESRMAQDEAQDNAAAYDVVCSFQVLEHVPDPRGFLAACASLLKPSGLLIVATPSEDSFLTLVGGGWLNMPPHHCTRWTDLALKNACESMGVRVNEVWHEPVAAYHRDWHESAMAMTALRRLVGLDVELGDTPRSSTLIRRMRHLPFMRRWLARQTAGRFPFAGHGHTVCIVGAK